MAGANVADLTLPPNRAVAPSDAREFSRSFVKVVQTLGPSVVRIDVRGDSVDSGRAGGGVGAGFVLDSDGHVATNEHILGGTSRVTVTLAGGEHLPAEVVAADALEDIAVLRTGGTPHPLAPVVLGNSDAVDIGEWVIAFGSPLGLDPGVTAGIVSARGKGERPLRMAGRLVREYIQTDVQLNPGDAGGPLVNLDAEVVGLNTLFEAGVGGGYGFAIPINSVRRIAAALLRDGRIRHPSLGLFLRDVVGATRKASKGASDRGAGVSVADVAIGGPAALAGVQVGDVIVSLDHTPIITGAALVDYLAAHKVGDHIKVNLLRGRRRISLDVTVGEL